MNSKAFILFALILLVSSTFAREMSQHDTKQTVQEETKAAKPTTQVDSGTVKGVGGGYSHEHGYIGGGGGGWSSGYSHGGVYGSGQHCHWGCCSESFGASHGKGGYYTCKCCLTAQEAKAYKENQAKVEIKN